MNVLSPAVRMSKILVIEDDLELLKNLSAWLKLEHHVVEQASRGSEALEKLKFFEYDLVIMDWGLPEVEGIEILREYRDKGGKTPILMLTGKSGIVDIEDGLESGADDYLTKPFNMRELSARVRALLRRFNKSYEHVFEAADLTLDPDKHLVCKQGKELKLQPKEFALLEFLLRNRNEPFSIETLLNRIWDSDTMASPDTVRVCITRLRNKIDTPGQPSIIETVHRMGYKIGNPERNQE
jgi:DNA-binding response OmpR family regulator